jgi:hypothetical protein
MQLRSDYCAHRCVADSIVFDKLDVLLETILGTELRISGNMALNITKLVLVTSTLSIDLDYRIKVDIPYV